MSTHRSSNPPSFSPQLGCHDQPILPNSHVLRSRLLRRPIEIDDSDAIDAPALSFPPPPLAKEARLSEWLNSTALNLSVPAALNLSVPAPLSVGTAFPSNALSSPPSVESFSYVKRIATYRLPPDETPIAAPEMSTYLGMELDGKSPIDVPDLIERLYHDDALPFPVNRAIFDHPAFKTIWSKSHKKWKFQEIYDEVALCEALNDIAAGLSNVFSLPIKRQWTARFRDVSPSYHNQYPHSSPPCRLKPDLVLVPWSNSPSTTVYWHNIRAIAEVTRSSLLPLRTKQTINNKSYVLMLSQAERVFVPFLTVYSRQRQRLKFRVTDREGQVETELALGSGGEVTALRLIRIVAALAFGGPELHGRDPTIRETKDHTTILAGGITYIQAKLIHFSQSMIGRCTRVWSAIDPETRSLVIIKDGWVHHRRASSEAVYLKLLQAAKVRGIPAVIWDGTVGSDVTASTLTIRRGCFQEQYHRIHRRLVMIPYGKPLTDFFSLVELISAFKDIVRVHESCIHHHVLHGDISLNNIILVERERNFCREGYLIDFDYASMYSSESSDAKGDQTGTLPFMAIEMMMKTPPKSSGNPDQIFIHHAKHDLESLFYVLLYICTFYVRPHEKLEPSQLLSVHTSVPILDWLQPEAFKKSFRHMGCLKLGHISNFERCILAKISPFYDPIKPFLVELKDAFFPASMQQNAYLNNQMTHSTMISIFDKMLTTIDVVGYVPPQKKMRTSE